MSEHSQELLPFFWPSSACWPTCGQPHRVKYRIEQRLHRHFPATAGNDFSTLYAPLIRSGRMEKFYWKPDREDLLAILQQMYKVGLYCL